MTTSDARQSKWSEGMTASDQIGMDLATHASERASKIMLDTFAMCDSPAQASMVAFKVLGVVAAQACGVITAHLGVKIDDIDSAGMLELMADMMREVKDDR